MEFGEREGFMDCNQVLDMHTRGSHMSRDVFKAEKGGKNATRWACMQAATTCSSSCRCRSLAGREMNKERGSRAATRPRVCPTTFNNANSVPVFA